jgi:hypothetical protein
MRGVATCSDVRRANGAERSGDLSRPDFWIKGPTSSVVVQIRRKLSGVSCTLANYLFPDQARIPKIAAGVRWPRGATGAMRSRMLVGQFSEP